MAEKPQFDPIIEPPPHPAEALQIDTPVIDIQDLEHNAGPDTRVNNEGVKVEPKFDNKDEREIAAEDEAVLEALEELEKSIRGQAPG